MSIKLYFLSRCSKIADVIQHKLQRKASRRAGQDQRGFSMLELILYAAIVGVLISVAAPKYNNAMASANTARVQSDLQTIDSAIAMYQAETSGTPADVDALSGYIVNASGVKPPSTGKVYIKGEISTITEAKYAISNVNGETRATLDSHTVSDFTKEKSASSQQSTGNGTSQT